MEVVVEEEDDATRDKFLSIFARTKPEEFSLRSCPIGLFVVSQAN